MIRVTPYLKAIAVLAAFTALSATDYAAAQDMKMPMSDTPAHFKSTRAAYTKDHKFLVKLLELPTPIPFEKYFTIRLGVYTGRAPHKKLSDAKVDIYAGMRHGLETGFAHGMTSTPKVTAKDGTVSVSGMYFHMMGEWTLKATVTEGGAKEVAYFRLPCCGE